MIFLFWRCHKLDGLRAVWSNSDIANHLKGKIVVMEMILYYLLIFNWRKTNKFGAGWIAVLGWGVVGAPGPLGCRCPLVACQCAALWSCCLQQPGHRGGPVSVNGLYLTHLGILILKPYRLVSQPGSQSASSTANGWGQALQPGFKICPRRISLSVVCLFYWQALPSKAPCVAPGAHHSPPLVYFCGPAESDGELPT